MVKNYDKLSTLNKLIYDGKAKICDECKGFDSCKQDLVGMEPFVYVRNGEYLVNSIQCGKRHGYILGNYKDAILTAPVLFQAREKLFSNLVNKKNGFIRGDAGHGKTTLMLNIAKYFYRKGYNVLYDLAINITIDLKDFSDDKESIAKKIAKYQNIDILFIDDLFREQVTSYKIMEILNPIIQYRIDNKLSTYINSNYSLDELSKMIEDKVDKISADAFCDRIRYNLGLFKLHDKNHRMARNTLEDL